MTNTTKKTKTTVKKVASVKAATHKAAAKESAKVPAKPKPSTKKKVSVGKAEPKIPTLKVGDASPAFLGSSDPVSPLDGTPLSPKEMSELLGVRDFGVQLAQVFTATKAKVLSLWSKIRNA